MATTNNNSKKMTHAEKDEVIAAQAQRIAELEAKLGKVNRRAPRSTKVSTTSATNPNKEFTVPCKNSRCDTPVTGTALQLGGSLGYCDLHRIITA